MTRFALLALAFLIGTRALEAQHPGHDARQPAPVVPREAGQDAFAAITELVRLLESDPTTNWSKVNLEAVRRHLIDMNDVVLQASPTTVVVPGGATFLITAPASVRPALLRMVTMHSAELNRMPEWHSSIQSKAGTTQMTVLARVQTDTLTAARIRGLGFIGLLATGNHHQAHHLAIARGMTDGHTGNH